MVGSALFIFEKMYICRHWFFVAWLANFDFYLYKRGSLKFGCHRVLISNLDAPICCGHNILKSERMRNGNGKFRCLQKMQKYMLRNEK